MRPVSVGVNPTAGVTTTIYTVPTGYYALFRVVYIHNTTGNNKTFTLQWFDTSANTTIDILSAYPFTAKQYLELNGNAYVVMEEGDQLRVTPESTSAFAVIATFDQIGLTRQ
jgi:hypothetical protein